MVYPSGAGFPSCPEKPLNECLKRVSVMLLPITGGNVLIIGHAISLDACTRQLVGQPARSQVSDVQSRWQWPMHK